MEAVGAGQELMKWEKTQETNAQEEKILVLVRLRPLSEKEIAVNEVADWECINNTTILYRNTLREGSAYPNAYTFDRVFRGDRSTKNVYEEGAQEIALSVVSGINSSIFAYGQTSSGKTYTMNGITEYTVADIFDYIHRHEERTFSLKLSAIEIYNEVVRDLLGTDVTPLRLLDDHERGTIVEGVTEETLKDWNHFKRLLTICEAQRHIGETSLNEKSSRSHQIIKLTLESSAREFLGKDNSTTLSASVSFVDLAGSERPSQASSAGVRLKEGCHINRSLLTLGTVIRKLSKGRHGHINYRDSKLTRILQPCLGVNARTAIICTLSPARSHVEQTRNALLFACCAKEVSTKAQVNIVMSDKALVKHLQREVVRLESELRSPMTPVPVSSSSEYAALLRKKDHQIEKMENDIRELTKQRDFAQSRVEDLLRMVGHEQDSIKTRESKSNHWQRENTLEDDCSASVSSSIADSLSLEVSDVRKLNDPNYYDADSENNPDEQNKKDITKVPIAEDSTDCKEIQCIEMEKASELLDNVPRNAVTGQELISTPVTENREVRQMQTGVFEKRFQNVEKTLASPVGVNPAVDVSNSRNFKVSRSWSCRENLMASSSSLEMAESTPHGFEKWFPERNLPPGHYGERYFRFDSQSSMGSAQSIRTTPDENITSLNTFISGLNQMAKLEPEKQPANENQETQKEIDTNVKVVGLGPMRDSFKISTDWPLEFERQQQMIIELWRTCNVSLIHRTYFFLLFRGDSNDSIYMEVELRRLTFLKDSFSCANQVMEDGRTLTVASSTRDLSREREMLSKLMQKRFSEEERERIFQKWGIALNSKRRRLQLINCLWTDPKDMNHIIESAAIVAKLVRFVEQGHALKGMFGLSFTPPQLKRGSHSWKNSVPYFS